MTFSGFIDCCASKRSPNNIHLKAHSSIITFEKLIWYHQILLVLQACDVFCVPIVTGDDVWNFVVFIFRRVCMWARAGGDNSAICGGITVSRSTSIEFHSAFVTYMHMYYMDKTCFHSSNYDDLYKCKVLVHFSLSWRNIRTASYTIPLIGRIRVY